MWAGPKRKSLLVDRAATVCSASDCSPHFASPGLYSVPVLISSRRFLRSGMGLWAFLEGFLLIANALAILNEQRFLAPRGWGFSEVSTLSGAKTMKGQFIGLIYAAQYLRLPLIIFNAVTIVVKLVSF